MASDPAWCACLDRQRFHFGLALQLHMQVKLLSTLSYVLTDGSGMGKEQGGP